MTNGLPSRLNATAPLRPEARAAAYAALDAFGNPSSVHAEGRAAHRLIEVAREQVAALVGAQARNVVFTSGGTEANVLALAPTATPNGVACKRLLLGHRASSGARGRPVSVCGNRAPAVPGGDNRSRGAPRRRRVRGAGADPHDACQQRAGASWFRGGSPVA
jgi:hypothetical protein